MEKQIEQITDIELLELWSLIGGAPHLFEQGKQELKEGLIKGSFEAVQMDYYSMAAVVDCLRAKGYQAGLPGHQRTRQLLVIASDGENEISYSPYNLTGLRTWTTGKLAQFLSEANSKYYSFEVLQDGARLIFVEITSTVSVEQIMYIVSGLVAADKGAVPNEG